MRKLIFSISIIIFTAFILQYGFIKEAFAQIEEGSIVAIPAPASDSAEILPQHVNYELPYPGMLPDNPFYFIKVARDTIVKALINDPYKKAQFSLLTSQKRMYAGKLLTKKGKTQLAFDTIEKSNNYLDDALFSIKEAKKVNPKNPDLNLFLEQFNTVTFKYGEILDEIKPITNSSYQEKLSWEKKRVLNIGKNVRELLK
jgi:hypothetical protein